MTGKSFEEARGQTIWDLFKIPDEQEHFKKLFQRIENTQSRTEYESSLSTRDGSSRTIAWSAALLPAIKTIPTYIIVSGIDVTGQKRAQARFRGLPEAAPDLCIENVGNLVCPSSYDLGENLRIVLLSGTEGKTSR